MRNIRSRGRISKARREKIPGQEDAVFSDDYVEIPFQGDHPEWLESGRDQELYRWTDSVKKRYHPNTLDAKFVGSPRQIQIPEVNLLEGLRAELTGVSTKRLRERCEELYGGPGLPFSLSPRYLKNYDQGHGLLAEYKGLNELDAKAFLAMHLPPAYAAAFVILREVRRRLGPDWIQSRLVNKEVGEMSVLDVGGGGAAIAAWNEICDAEWGLLEERGMAHGPRPMGENEGILVGSAPLRDHLKRMFPHVKFMSSLPDYAHSGSMYGDALDGGKEKQARKKYDVVIASHNLLTREKYWQRRHLLYALWNLVDEKDGVLIVIERGDQRGAQAVGDIRDILLREVLLPQTGDKGTKHRERKLFNSTDKEEVRKGAKFERQVGHLIAPCTNHAPCPMWRANSTYIRDFCHFRYQYWMPTFYRNMISYKTEVRGPISGGGDVKFCYVAVRRGHARKSTLSGAEATDRAFEGYTSTEHKPDAQTLPRLIMPPLKRQGHICMDVCTPDAKIERWIVPKSHGHQAFHDVRKCSWGDLWALGAKTRIPRKLELGGQNLAGRDEHKQARRWARVKKHEQLAMVAEGKARESLRVRRTQEYFEQLVDSGSLKDEKDMEEEDEEEEDEEEEDEEEEDEEEKDEEDMEDIEDEDRIGTKK
ncbi:hypothetical protein CDD82_6587 [Ophiocordyceps australis]|uniref:37S ribosomal protein S22 n=1 Tax=Ophiocordyceps australis TaxID=1399860 RepID=A0A2C5XG96_9HYPO|nr:hypothetical protein CDD82_6587 [Ophiocordyceps australis]